jgi:hypothetical protein
MATAPAGARVSQRFDTRISQAQSAIQLAVSQRPGIGGDCGAAKFQAQPTVVIEPSARPLHPSPRRLSLGKTLNFLPETAPEGRKIAASFGRMRVKTDHKPARVVRPPAAHRRAR